MSQTTQSPNSDLVTDGVRVRAAARYVPEQSNPDRSGYVYEYHIEIENQSEQTVQLRSRHWIILDAHGRREDVRGDGVVGEFPRLEPGESYRYGSRCPLRTSWGTMEGSYRFLTREGEEFDVKVGRFFLVPSSAGE